MTTNRMGWAVVEIEGLFYIVNSYGRTVLVSGREAVFETREAAYYAIGREIARRDCLHCKA